MKFTKTALAVAFAGMAAAPIASADVTLSGYLGFIIEGTDEDGDAANLGMVGDDSTLNVNASHELNSGLTGYGNWRVDAALVGSGASADNVHVGIKGGFGDVRIGEVPDALEYGQMANDALFDIGGENQGISYTGNFGPATIGLNWSPEGSTGSQNFRPDDDDDLDDRAGSDKIAAGVKFNIGGFALGVGVASIPSGDPLGFDDDDIITEDATAYSVGASFGFAGASIAVALKSMEGDITVGGVDIGSQSRETVGATLGYGIGDVSLKLTYEVETGDLAEDDNIIRLDAGYGLGGGMNISTRISSYTDENDGLSGGDLTEYRLLLSKDF